MARDDLLDQARSRARHATMKTFIARTGCPPIRKSKEIGRRECPDRVLDPDGTAPRRQTARRARGAIRDRGGLPVGTPRKKALSNCPRIVQRSAEGEGRTQRRSSITARHRSAMGGRPGDLRPVGRGPSRSRRDGDRPRQRSGSTASARRRGVDRFLDTPEGAQRRCRDGSTPPPGPGGSRVAVR